MGFIKALLCSRKFWITVGACVAAAYTDRAWLIPAILMAEVCAITVEDAAEKLGLPWAERSNGLRHVNLWPTEEGEEKADEG